MATGPGACVLSMQRCTWSCRCEPSTADRRWFPTTIRVRTRSTSWRANTWACRFGLASMPTRSSTSASTCGALWSGSGTRWTRMRWWMVVSLSPTSVLWCGSSGMSWEHLSLKPSTCRKPPTDMPMEDHQHRPWRRMHVHGGFPLRMMFALKPTSKVTAVWGLVMPLALRIPQMWVLWVHSLSRSFSWCVPSHYKSLQATHGYHMLSWFSMVLLAKTYAAYTTMCSSWIS